MAKKNKNQLELFPAEKPKPPFKLGKLYKWQDMMLGDWKDGKVVMLSSGRHFGGMYGAGKSYLMQSAAYAAALQTNGVKIDHIAHDEWVVDTETVFDPKYLSKFFPNHNHGG